MQWQLITDLDADACADPRDRGLHYGDGLFETLLIRDRRLFYWAGHFRRLQQGAERLGIPCPAESELLEAIDAYRQPGEDCILKLILTRGVAERGAVWPRNPLPTVLLSGHRYTPMNRPLRAVFAKHALPQNPALAGIKHLNRLDHVLASRELPRHPDVDQLILCDAAGRVIETLIHNLFLVRDGEIRTPALHRCGVEGVMRREIMKKLEQAGKAVRIDDCSRDDLLDADECFVCNSVQGIRALERIENREFPTGPWTRKLQKIFNGH